MFLITAKGRAALERVRRAGGAIVTRTPPPSPNSFSFLGVGPLGEIHASQMLTKMEHPFPPPSSTSLLILCQNTSYSKCTFFMRSDVSQSDRHANSPVSYTHAKVASLSSLRHHGWPRPLSLVVRNARWRALGNGKVINTDPGSESKDGHAKTRLTRKWNIDLRRKIILPFAVKERR